VRRIRALLEEARALLRLPEVRIVMSGDERAHDLYRIFTRRHARWRVIRNKAWGVALLEIPEDRAGYDRHVSRATRRNVRRAELAGLSFRPIDPLEHVDEILEIHRSTPERQGRPMHPHYADEARVRAYLADTAEVFGVFDPEGVLRAYLCLRDCGEVVCLERLLGHATSLEQGPMYLLFSGVVDWLIAYRAAGGRAHWLYYDMFPGASPGLRSFKHFVGFRPYRVNWSWRED
jgi:hypothetical protein